MADAWIFKASTNYAIALATRCAAGVALSPEPISAWTEACDLKRFLGDIFDCDFQRTSETGQVDSGNFRSYGYGLFEQGRSAFLQHADRFRSTAISHQDSPIPNFSVRIDPVPLFEADSRFGAMAKAAIAWDGVIDAILSESLFYSLAHTIEARSELDCSLLLASNLYYKQALQVLRGMIELSVLHLYFAAHVEDYKRWEASSFRVPSLRAKKTGLLAILEADKLVPPSLANQISDLYEALNGTIHSTERRLIHSGLFQGQWAGYQFKDDQFADWCEFVIRSVDVGVRMMSETLRVVAMTPEPAELRCDTCHDVSSFEVVADAKPVVGYLTVRCGKCGAHRTVAQRS